MDFTGKEIFKKEVLGYLEKCISKETLIPLDDYVSDRVDNLIESIQEIVESGFDIVEEILDFFGD